MKTYIVSGYFINGFTAGHKEMLSAIKERMVEGDELVVIVNNEMQQKQKYKTKTRPYYEIFELIDPFLNTTFGDRWATKLSIDRDKTVRETLKWCKDWFMGDKVFVNDGDVTKNCIEEEVRGVEFLYLGQPKISSSGEEKWS